MALGYRLDLKQSQQLVMTPQLQQAIKLLQMSNLELREFVERELETNPLIRVAGAEDIRPGDTPQLVGKSRETGETPLDAQLTPEGNHDLGAETFDHGAENLYDTGAAEFATRPAVAAGGRHDFEATAFDLEQEPDHPVSLRDHLLAQIGLSRAEPQTVALARLLVEELDEHGYLRADLAELAERFGALPEQIDVALALVQGCEPTGVGARDVAECLALQLAEHDRLDPAMKRLLANLTHLERGDRRRLRALCEVDEDDFIDMLAELRALDPRPCARFQTDRAETLIPDVLLRRVPSNGQAGGLGSGWQLELNPDTLPRVLVDNRYAARLAPARGAAAKEARSFLSNCRANANWLVRSPLVGRSGKLTWISRIRSVLGIIGGSCRCGGTTGSSLRRARIRSAPWLNSLGKMRT